MYSCWGARIGPRQHSDSQIAPGCNFAQLTPCRRLPFNPRSVLHQPQPWTAGSERLWSKYRRDSRTASCPAPCRSLTSRATCRPACCGGSAFGGCSSVLQRLAFARTQLKHSHRLPSCQAKDARSSDIGSSSGASEHLVQQQPQAKRGKRAKSPARNAQPNARGRPRASQKQAPNTAQRSRQSLQATGVPGSPSSQSVGTSNVGSQLGSQPVAGHLTTTVPNEAASPNKAGMPSGRARSRKDSPTGEPGKQQKGNTNSRQQMQASGQGKQQTASNTSNQDRQASGRGKQQSGSNTGSQQRQASRQSAHASGEAGEVGEASQMDDAGHDDELAGSSRSEPGASSGMDVAAGSAAGDGVELAEDATADDEEELLDPEEIWHEVGDEVPAFYDNGIDIDASEMEAEGDVPDFILLEAASDGEDDVDSSGDPAEAAEQAAVQARASTSLPSGSNRKPRPGLELLWPDWSDVDWAQVRQAAPAAEPGVQQQPQAAEVRRESPGRNRPQGTPASPSRAAPPRLQLLMMTPEHESAGFEPGYFTDALQKLGLLTKDLQPTKRALTGSDYGPNVICNKLLTHSLRWQSMLHVARDMGHLFDRINAATAMHRLAKLAKQDRVPLRVVKAHPDYPRLLDVVRLQCQMQTFQPRQLGNTAWAFATLGENVPDILEGLAENSIRADPRVWKEQEMSNLIWAYGTFGEPRPALCEYMANAALERRFDTFAPQAISNMLWGFANMNYCHKDFLLAVAQHVIKHVHAFPTQAISNTVWSFSAMEAFHEDMFRAVALEVRGRLHEFNPQELSNVILSYAKTGFVEYELMEAFEEELSRPGRLHSFRPQAIANVLWAFATLRFYPERTLAACVAQIAQRIDAFKDQELSNSIWAFARLGYHPGREVLQQYGVTIQRKVRLFTAQALANILWALSVLQATDLPAFQILVDEMSALDPTSVELVQLHQLCQGLMLARLERRPGQPPIDIPASVDGIVTRTWKRMVTNTQLSNFHEDVSGALAGMGVEHENEFLVADGRFSVDIALRGQKVAVEVDGPFHFTINTRKPTGSTILRRRLLKAYGWTLVSVPFYEYYRFSTKREKMTYLRDLLTSVDQAGAIKTNLDWLDMPPSADLFGPQALPEPPAERHAADDADPAAVPLAAAPGSGNIYERVSGLQRPSEQWRLQDPADGASLRSHRTGSDPDLRAPDLYAPEQPSQASRMRAGAGPSPVQSPNQHPARQLRRLQQGRAVDPAQRPEWSRGDWRADAASPPGSAASAGAGVERDIITGLPMEGGTPPPSRGSYSDPTPARPSRAGEGLSPAQQPQRPAEGFSPAQRPQRPGEGSSPAQRPQQPGRPLAPDMPVGEWSSRARTPVRRNVQQRAGNPRLQPVWPTVPGLAARNGADAGAELAARPRRSRFDAYQAGLAASSAGTGPPGATQAQRPSGSTADSQPKVSNDAAGEPKLMSGPLRRRVADPKDPYGITKRRGVILQRNENPGSIWWRKHAERLAAEGANAPADTSDAGDYVARRSAGQPLRNPMSIHHGPVGSQHSPMSIHHTSANKAAEQARRQGPSGEFNNVPLPGQTQSRTEEAPSAGSSQGPDEPPPAAEYASDQEPARAQTLASEASSGPASSSNHTGSQGSSGSRGQHSSALPQQQHHAQRQKRPAPMSAVLRTDAVDASSRRNGGGAQLSEVESGTGRNVAPHGTVRDSSWRASRQHQLDAMKLTHDLIPLCRKYRLPVYGRKQEVVERLLSYEETHAVEW